MMIIIIMFIVIRISNGIGDEKINYNYNDKSNRNNHNDISNCKSADSDNINAIIIV